MPWHPQILADQLTLSQPGGADYAHQIILAPPDFQTFRRPSMVLHGRYAICVCICWVPICPFFLIPYVETSNVVSTYKTMDSLGAIPEDRNVLCCTQVHFSKISSFCNFLRSL